jgi:hypothetical protein
MAYRFSDDRCIGSLRNLPIVACSQIRVPLAGQEKSPEIAKLLCIQPPHEITWTREGRHLLPFQGMAEALQPECRDDAQQTDSHKPPTKDDGRK